jgi:LmbE family N-acetylglucosaminyl deacetylase
MHREQKGYKVLCLGAHSDDIEIGCGGSILRLTEENKGTEIRWVVFSALGQRAVEATESAQMFLRNAGEKNVTLCQFRDGFFPFIGAEIKDFFEQLKTEFSPDLIFTHYSYDLHQDHRLISELTWNTFRDHVILEYEIPKYDGDMGSPNLFFHLNERIGNRKVEIIRGCFKSQGNRTWFRDDIFFSLLRLRGLESNAPDMSAEGFYCRKLIL